MFCVIAVAGVLLSGGWSACAQGSYRQAGYLYLSPLPNSPYTSPQTRFVLVRFENVTPSDVTNLTTSFITVAGASSGVHEGVTHVASDGRTVIFTMTNDFSYTELVTVTLNPELAPGTTGSVEPFEYQFVINGPMPGATTATVTTTAPVLPDDLLNDQVAEMSKENPSPANATPHRAAGGGSSAPEPGRHATERHLRLP